MKPTRDNVLISRVEPNLTTESGIILKNPLEPDRALIKAIGPEVTEVSVGEETMVDWNKAVQVGDNEYIIDINDIVMVFE